MSDLRERFDSWNGGVYPRFSPSNNTLHAILGHKPTPESSKKLKGVVEALLEWIHFVDSLLGKRFHTEIPYEQVRQEMKKTCKAVKDAMEGTEEQKGGEKYSLDFSLFRLSVLTTILAGARLVKPGPHLYQLNILAVEAARKHLVHSYGSDEKQSNDDKDELKNHPDTMMYLISSGMKKWPIYRRMLVENYLCESKPMRELVKDDVFRRGQCIFDIRTEDGLPMFKPYGKNYWESVPEPRNKSCIFAKHPGGAT